MHGKLKDVPEAIRRLRAASIPVVERDYGFSLDHPEWNEHRHGFAQCGWEHDGSISLMVCVDERPPVAWFFRSDVLEMADFIICAYRRSHGTIESGAIVAAMREEDSRYNRRSGVPDS